MAIIFFAIGLVCVIEGLVLALAPNRLEDIIRAISEMSLETRRTIGLTMLLAGVILIWLSKPSIG